MREVRPGITERAGRILRFLSWKHWLWATIIPILVLFTLRLQWWTSPFSFGPAELARRLPVMLAVSYVLLIGVAGIETRRDGSRAPVWQYLALIALSTALAGAVRWVTFAPGVVLPKSETPRWRQNIVGDGRGDARLASSAGMMSVVLLHGSVAVFIYRRFRNAREAARSLSDAQLERADAERRLAASLLEAAHAQVDPATVFQRLDELERAYAVDALRGDALLDDLVAFLRGAIPRLREEADEPAVRETVLPTRRHEQVERVGGGWANEH
jgi:hypothetical protein